MKQKQIIFLVIILFSLLQGCKSQGSSAPAPNNVAAVTGDTSVTISWDSVSGVEYWVFKAAANDVTPLNCFGMSQCQIFTKAVSPLLVTGLTNGTNYSFTVNGRIDGGKGGPGSPSVQAIPRLAGSTWSTGTSLGASDLHGITYGTVFVSVGNNGALFSSSDGISWTTLTNPLPSANLNAVTYYGGKYLAVGAGGAILTSADAITWQQQTSNTTNDLYAVANSMGVFVATGANGTILTSIDGTTWSVIPPITSNALYGITYGNSKYLAVGANGTIITSADASIWQTVTPLTASGLKTVTYGYAAGTTTGMFVALGDMGTLLTSSDGTSWNTQTQIASTPLINAVTYGRQFIAAGNTGGIYTSTDGISWTLATTALSPLYAITHGPYDYTAVGSSGLNMHSK
jgi:hypothetical protein